jgi:hypothetical protein
MRWSFARFIGLGAGLGLGSPCYAETTIAPTAPPSGTETTVPNTSDTDDPTLVRAFPETGFQWGLALGFGLPLGNADAGASLFANTANGEQPFVTRDGSMSSIVSYHVSLALDLGYRLGPNWWVGIRPQAATGGNGDQCPTGANCHFSDARLSALLKYNSSPHSSLNPWFGVGLGWEWLMTTLTAAIPESVGVKQNLSGPLLQALGGLGFDFADHIHAGPYAAVAVGRYIWNGLECSAALGCPGSYFVKDGAFHAWLSVGISGEYGP